MIMTRGVRQSHPNMRHQVAVTLQRKRFGHETLQRFVAAFADDRS
jgi:hypothetical protein